MSGFIEAVNGLGWSELLALVNVLWQCTAVFLIAFAAIKLSRPRSATTRHLVWLLALSGVALCPLVTLMMQQSGARLFQVPIATPTMQTAVIEPVSTELPPENPAGPDEEDAAFWDGMDGPEGASLADLEHVGAAEGSAGALDTEAAEAGPAEGSDGPMPPPASGLDSSRRAAGPGGTPGVVSMLEHGWPAIVVLAWAVGCACLILRLLVAQLALLRLVGRSQRLSDSPALSVLMSVRQKAGVSRHVEFGVSDRLAVPVAARILRPTVLLPTRLVEQLPESDLEVIAAHELTHIKRRDPFVRLFEQVVHAVLFFHPAVWLIVRELNVEREEICDEAVVRITQRPLEYAKCLTSLHDQLRALPRYKLASVGVAHYRSRLSKRVEAILSGKLAALRQLSRRTIIALVAAALLSIGLIASTGVVQRQAAGGEGKQEEPQEPMLDSEQRGCVFSGRVTDEMGNALAEVEILAWGMDQELGTVVGKRFRSAADGSFEITGLPPADNSIFFRKEGMIVEGFHGDGRDFVSVRFRWPGQRKDNIQVRMLKPEFIDGVVVDGDGKPVEGATVDLWSYVTTSGRDGSFKAPDPRMRNLTARVSVPGYVKSMARYNRAADGDTWTITLSRGCTVSGRIVNAESGEAVGGARLVCPRYEVDETSGEHGTYILEHLPSELLHFLVRKGKLVAEVEIDCTRGEDLAGFDIALTQGGTIAGRMLDAATGAPLKNAPVSALARYLLATEAESDENGFYRLEGLAPGEHALFPNARNAGQEPGFSRRVLHVDAGQVIEGIDFQVDTPEPPTPPDPNQPRIEGKVLDERRRPLSDVSLLVFADEDPEPRKSVGGLSQTDVTGEFTSLSPYYKLDTGTRYLIQASHPVYGVKEVRGGTIPERTKRKDLTIVFERFVSVSGRVVDAEGHPITWAQIFVCEKGKAVPEAGGYRRYRWDSSTRRLWTDADGSYEVLGLPNGSYVLEVEHEDYFADTMSADVEISGEQRRAPDRDFVLTAYEKGFIAGQVIDENGDPVAGARIEASRREPTYYEKNTKTDRHGEFRFDALNEGTFRLQVWDGQQAGRVDDVSINTAGVIIRTEKSKPWAEPSFLHAKIVDAEGDPITVFVVQSSQRSQPVEHHSETGEYREEYSVRGTVNREITITAEGYQTTTVECRLVEGQTTDITITMVKGEGTITETMTDHNASAASAAGQARTRDAAGGADANAAATTQSSRWVNEGGPYVGHLYALVVDPSNPQVLYAGGHGGLFKSVDGAKTWGMVEACNERNGVPRRVYDIAIDPRDGNTVYVVSLAGMFKTTDGGRSWDSLVDSFSPMQVELDPTEPSVLYATDWNRKGLFKSIDRGVTWESKMKGLRWPPLRPLSLDPRFPRTLYAVCEKAARFRSEDAGRTWRTVMGNIESVSVKSFEQDPDNDRAFTVTISYNGDHVFETTNRGADWSPDPVKEIGLYLDRLEIEKVEPGDVPGMTLQLRSPRDCEIGLTRDGAETWRLIQVPCGWPELRGIRVDPQGRDLLYLGTDKGVYYYSADDGETWELLYSAEDDPEGKQPETIRLLRESLLHGVEDEGRYIELSDLAVDPSNADVMYHLDENRGVRKSEDGGKTWIQASRGLAMFSAQSLACSRTTPGVVYASGQEGFFLSRDRASSWQRLASVVSR